MKLPRFSKPKLTKKNVLLAIVAAAVIAIIVTQRKRQTGGSECNTNIEKPYPMANTAYEGTVLGTFTGDSMDDLYDRCRNNCKCVAYDSTGNLFSSIPDSGTGKDGVSTAVFWSRLSGDDNGGDDNGDGKKKRKKGFPMWAKVLIAVGLFAFFVIGMAKSATSGKYAGQRS